MQMIISPSAPSAVGPYSHAVLANGTLYCSGQLPINPSTGKIETTDIQKQTLQVITNLRSVLGSANMSLTNIVKATVFLKDMNNFQEMNTVYSQEFGSHKPARSTIEVARLPMDAMVEIECIASKEKYSQGTFD